MAFTAISKLDPVSRNCVWEEHVKKESKNLKLTESFMITNPDKMVNLPDKPNHMNPGELLYPEGLQEAHATLAALTAKRTGGVPAPERCALPPTANSEYGFFAHNNMPCPHSLFHKPLATCDVTQYAAEYAAMTGCSPHMAKKDAKQ